KPTKDILAKKIISISTSTLANNISINFTTFATITYSILLYRRRIFIGLYCFNSNSIDFY
ncbi:hypothetical protein QR685DRAFT_433329, partial [Neurospora intermedia]